MVNSYVNPVPLGVVSAMAIVIITTAGLFLVCFKVGNHCKYSIVDIGHSHILQCRENDYCHLFSREAVRHEYLLGFTNFILTLLCL